MLNRKIDERELLRLLSGMSRLFQGCSQESDILDVAENLTRAKQTGRNRVLGCHETGPGSE